MFCRSAFVVLVIVLSVLLRYTDSDYTKQDRKQTRLKHKQAQQIPNTKARVSIQSEEQVKDDSEEQAVHIIPH
jgi:preprotein translocase subunit SecG